MGATQILIWFYSCVFLPTVSTAIRTSLFSFLGALKGLLRVIFKEVVSSWPVGDIKIEKVAIRVGQWSPVKLLAEAVSCK